MTDIVTQEDIRTAELELQERVIQYLERFGWRYTSNTPGNYWLWVKTLDDGRTVLARQDDAVGMTRICWDTLT